MDRSGQGEIIEQVVARAMAIAPGGWARFVGNWEATRPEGQAHLNYITLAVVEHEGRWALGQFDFDEPLYDLVAHLHDIMTEAGEQWTTLDLEVDADGRFRTQFGYGEPKRTNGVLDEESLGRFERYLETWVAEHGDRPGDGAQPDSRPGRGEPAETRRAPAHGSTDETIQAIIDGMRAAGESQSSWLRLVGQWFRPSVDGSPSGGIISTSIAMVVGPDRQIRATNLPLPDEIGALANDLVTLARGTGREGWTLLRVMIDRTGEVAVTFDDSLQADVQGVVNAPEVLQWCRPGPDEVAEVRGVLDRITRLADQHKRRQQRWGWLTGRG
ncbi:hypothetical protein ACQP1U_04215 [Actinomycetota bacterium]